MRNTENPKLFWRNCLTVRQAGNIIICFSKYCLQIVSDGGGDKKGCSLLQISCSLESDLDEVLMPVSVISTGHLTRPEVRIGQVTISRNSSWIHLDSCLRGLVKTYLDCLDPEHSLELTSQSMVCYQCGNIRWQHLLFLLQYFYLFLYRRVFKNPEPERRPSLLPDTRIWISFRGGTDRGSLEDLSFISLLPRTTLAQCVSTVWKYQRAILVGPPASGKSFLATKLAEYLVLKSGQELTPDSVCLFAANQEQNQWEEFLSTLRSRPPTVIILDNIQTTNIQHILDKLGPTIEETPFLLCTSTEQVKEVNERLQLAEITLGNDVDVLQGLLGRVLRRKMLNIEVGTRLANLDIPEAIQWLLRIYCNLYIFVKTTSHTQSFLSPSVFMSCPVDSTQHLKTWFIDHWNSSQIPRLRQVTRQNQEQRVDWEDPVKFVLRTWPWRDEVEGLAQTLLTVNTRRISEPSNAKDDPLVISQL